MRRAVRIGDNEMRGRWRSSHGSIWLPAAALCALVAQPRQADAGREIWISSARLASLPVSGPAWEALRAAADRPLSLPDLSDKDSSANIHVLAKALVYARTGQTVYRDEVINACLAAIATEGGDTLALGRELAAYVIAADLVGLPPAQDAAFRAWLRRVRNETIGGRTLVSTHADRPNNWGTHAGASRIAVAAYLGDNEDLAHAATVFRGWLGERSEYAGFKYGSVDWQTDERTPRGINPAGTSKLGHSIDGVLPDDQRRSGAFRWPPPRENYVYEALQGALAQAVLLHRLGFDVWEWSDRALLRAFRWLHEQADYPANGDDTWQPHIINYYYGAGFPAPVPSQPGKNVGWTDWTHARGVGEPDDGGLDEGGLDDGGGGGGGSAGLCPAAPPGDGCRLQGAAKLLITQGSRNTGSLRWRWTEGPEAASSDWGEPAAATEFALCTYDSAPGSTRLGLALPLPAGSDWSSRNDRRQRYRARALERTVSLRLHGGPPGRASIRLKLRARPLELVTLAPPAKMFAQDPVATILAVNDRGDCWSSPFSVAETLTNTPRAFRAKSR